MMVGDYMLTVKETNKLLVEKKIKELIKIGIYKDINDIKRRNPSLEEFCFNNKLNFIIHSFSTQFTNNDYIALLNNMNENFKNYGQNENDLKQTNINGQVFIDKKQNINDSPALVGIDTIDKIDNANYSYDLEKKFEKKEATFKKLNEIDYINLNKDQMLIYTTVLNDNEANKYSIFVDENGNLTNIVKDNNNNYFTIEIIDGKPTFVNQNQISKEYNKNNSKEKQNVLTLSNKHNISAAFTNTLILSFIIGSFFGIIFLAIYTKLMH